MKIVEETPVASVSSVVQLNSETPAAAPEPAHPLMAEVESFLSKRDELARKLALEIEATEKKLAELKKTAASLFPEAATHEQPDKKAKKLKTKSSNKEAKSDSSNAAENQSSAEATN